MTWRTPAAAALGHSRRGWVLVPLKPGTGMPARKWKNLARTPPGSVAAHWPGPTYNPGILTGPSGLVVTDLDDADAHDTKIPAEWAALGVTHGSEVLAVLADRAKAVIPATYTVTTPRGGKHLYFAAAAQTEVRNSSGKVGPAIDIRGRGGLVVGAGSVREGRAYEVLDDRDPVPLPGWLAELAARPVTRGVDVTRDARGHGNSDVRGYAAAALRGEIDILLATGRGQRNSQLNRSAYSLGTLVGAGMLTKADVTGALMDAAVGIGLVDDDGRGQCERTIASGLAAGVSQPRSRRAA
jgi:hypothetical protein